MNNLTAFTFRTEWFCYFEAMSADMRQRAILALRDYVVSGKRPESRMMNVALCAIMLDIDRQKGKKETPETPETTNNPETLDKPDDQNAQENFETPSNSPEISASPTKEKETENEKESEKEPKEKKNKKRKRQRKR